MSSKTREQFFKIKKPWSIIKDEILQCYLRPYANKLFMTEKPILYVDCFAGAGLYGEIDKVPFIDIKNDNIPSELGSPFIACTALSRAASETSKKNPEWMGVFIEKKYYKQLEKNINESQFAAENLICQKGDFKSCLPDIIESIRKQSQKDASAWNFFCYIDPFGIKDLQMDILKRTNVTIFNTRELLINFNSFGLMRAMCACYNMTIHEADINNLIDSDEYNFIEDEVRLLSSSARAELFNSIFACTEWRHIIENYKAGNFNGYETEIQLTNLYKEQIKKELGYKFVLELPILERKAAHPKYRMIFTTNHEDGACIMGGVMNKRSENQLEALNHGQLDLFEDITSKESLDNAVNKYLSLVTKEEQRAKSLTAQYFDKFSLYGATPSTIISAIEKENLATVRRDPVWTSSGKKSKFCTEDDKHKIYISKL